MPAEKRDQNDDWDRYAYEIKQNGPHRNLRVKRWSLGAEPKRRQLDPLHTIPLSAPDGRGVACAKRADQKSKKDPQQQMRRRFAGAICYALCSPNNFNDPSFGIGLAKSRS